MNYKLYAIIFFAKIIENALGTLRVIVIANRKKILGSILNGLIALLWVFVTSITVVGIMKDPFKIIFFCLGSVFGSYLGCIMEEKLALGTNLLIAIVDMDLGDVIASELRKEDYAVTVMEGYGKDKERQILMIMTPRKKTQDCVSLIRCLDIHAMVLSENASTICGGYSCC